MSTVSLGSKLN